MIDKFPFRSRPGAAIQDAKYIALRYILKAWEDAVHDGLKHTTLMLTCRDLRA